MDTPPTLCHDGTPIIEVIDALPDGVQNPAEVDRVYLPATIDGELRALRRACEDLCVAGGRILKHLDCNDHAAYAARWALIDAMSAAHGALKR